MPLPQNAGCTIEPPTTALHGTVPLSRRPALLLSIAAACTLAFFLPRAFSPWNWFYDENGALYGLMGANYLRTGLSATRGGAQHWTSFEGAIRQPEFYSTHPPLLPWLCGLSQWLLGMQPFAVRIIPTIGQLVSLIPLFLLGRRLFGAHAAAWGTLLYALLPMCAYFGFAVCYESLNNMFILWAVYLYVHISDAGWTWGKASLLVLSLLAGMWTDWPAYFTAMGIGVDWFFTERGWRRLRAAVPWGTGLASFALFVAFIFQLGGTGSGGLGSLFNAFRNRTGINPDESYSLADFAAFLARQNLELYGLGLVFLVGGLWAMRDHRGLRPVLVLWATATLHVAAFSYGAMTHEYWTFYFVGPSALGAMALFARCSKFAASGPSFILAALLSFAQCIWVIADYRIGFYREWADAYIKIGQTIAPRARASEVVMMPFGWGEGAIVAYYAERPMVRCGSFETLNRIRRHPHYSGGYLVLTWDFMTGDGGASLESMDSLGEVELIGDHIKILRVPPMRDTESEMQE